jgi:hypothetical protein
MVNQLPQPFFERVGEQSMPKATLDLLQHGETTKF